MKLSFSVKLNLKIPEVQRKVREATRLGLRDTIVAIHGDAIRNAIIVKFYRTGNNNRSITSEVSGMGTIKGPGAEKLVDDAQLEAACYSTSGYGGFGETGTYKMAARPYFEPALNANKNKLIPSIKEHLED